MVIESGQSGAFTYLFTNVNANTYIMINKMQKQQQNTYGRLSLIMAVNMSGMKTLSASGHFRAHVAMTNQCFLIAKREWSGRNLR